MRSALYLLVFLTGCPLLWAGPPNVSHEFAQIGAGGGVRTIFLVLSMSEDAASLKLELFGDDGSPLSLLINGAEGSQFESQLVAGGSLRIEVTSNSGLPMAGSARLTASRLVGAQVLFEISVQGELLTQAAVEALPPLDRAEIFVDTTTGQTGIAIANVSNVAGVRIQLTLKNEAGAILASQEIELPRRGHLAAFIVDLFAGEADALRGSLQILATGGVAVVTLQQSGLILGTLPVVTPWS